MDLPIGALLARAAERLDAGSPVWGCLVVGSRGSTPQVPGSLMLVEQNGTTHGTIGGGCVESEVRSRAISAMASGAAGVHSFKLDHDYGWDDGLICGGTLEVAIGPLPAADQVRSAAETVAARRPATLRLDAVEPGVYTLEIPPKPRLYIAGAGHVGQAVARHGTRLDFETRVFDDRADLLDRVESPLVLKTPGDIAAGLADAPIDGGTYCVVVTRGHTHDEQALAAVVGRGAAYVGMIGSRRKVKLIFDDLRSAGVAQSDLDAVHAPIGLDISSVTVEEIAVSIAAQLVSTRSEAPRPRVLGPAASAGASV